MSLTRLFNSVLGRKSRKRSGIKEDDHEAEGEDSNSIDTNHHTTHSLLSGRSLSSDNMSPVAASLLANLSGKAATNDLAFGVTTNNPALELQTDTTDSIPNQRERISSENSGTDLINKWSSNGRVDSTDSRALTETPSGRSNFLETIVASSPDTTQTISSSRLVSNEDASIAVKNLNQSFGVTTDSAISPMHPYLPFPPSPTEPVSKLIISTNRRKANSVNSYPGDVDTEIDSDWVKAAGSSTSSRHAHYAHPAPSPIFQRTHMTPLTVGGDQDSLHSEKSEYEGFPLARIQGGSFRSVKSLQGLANVAVVGTTQCPTSPVHFKSPSRPKALSIGSFSTLEMEHEWEPTSSRLHTSGIRNASMSPMIVVRSHSNSLCSSPRNDLDGHSRLGDMHVFDSRPMATVSSSRTVQIPDISWSHISIEGISDALVGRGTYGSVVRATYTKSDMECPGLCFEDVVVKVMIKSVQAHLSTQGQTHGPIHGQIHTLQSSLRSPPKPDSSRSHATDDLSDTQVPRVMSASVREVTTTLIAESRMAYKECITKVYGICDGLLPSALCQLLKVSSRTEAVGIVMRHESGGTLHSLLHPNSSRIGKKNLFKSSPEKAMHITITDRSSFDSVKSSSDASVQTTVVSVTERVRLLMKIARGLAELHVAGVVHGDMKPENILLSGSTPAEIRIADFGFSVIHELAGLDSDEIEYTRVPGGTPRYSAPEMMLNPFEEDNEDLVAAASRKTDVYAFAILAWEVLTGELPFADIRHSPLLGTKVHQGHRPDIDKIPHTVPRSIVQMIEACWDGDRQKRKSAQECYSVLQSAYQSMLLSIDICVLCCHTDIDRVGSQLSQLLAASGLRVLLSDGDKSRDIIFNSSSSSSEGELNKTNTSNSSSSSKITQSYSSSSSAIGNGDGSSNDRTQENTNNSSDPKQSIYKCKILVACISREFLTKSNCVRLLRLAKKASIVIVPLFLESHYKAWVTQELIFLCQLQSHAPVYYEILPADSTATVPVIDDSTIDDSKSVSEVTTIADPDTAVTAIDKASLSNVVKFLCAHERLN